MNAGGQDIENQYNTWISFFKNIKELTNILGKKRYCTLANSLPQLCVLPQQPALMDVACTITNYL